MSLNKPDREAIIKAAKEADKVKEVRFSESQGSVYIDKTKYTDRHAALEKLKGK
ncbi:hypothetical protein [Chitinophaga pinensis]|uniref:Uncharacterized protein n=1 Tax=Chitinophaga pinensis (strain ATCC 43595 / DSM 2588 / LMG 13176 / NBRC 15968 / NCIMB 11800 / UQM 2034) TaxID=485918 RepID=A0A979GAH8_CHIPD|nr:hypothetical protein [Chitinophaga pinensis]ACU63732.1 hypothetical protein Cpin_6327 [Chitinophaga pinensis DSM 2588]